MKITREQLKNIVQEELKSVVDEGFFSRLFGGGKKKPEAAAEPAEPEGPSEEELVAGMKKEAEANAVEDAKKREEIDKINQADSMAFQTEKQLKDNEDKIDESSREEMTSLVSDLRKAITEKDLVKIDELMESMNTKWQEVSQQMYQETQNEDTQSETDSTTTDVDFEEVK